MRIIAGEYRGRILKSPPDLRTRPTSDRLRETLFNIIAPRIDAETRFLDLCAGTGAVGIEAISRGACHSTFVDRSRRACGLIETNLDLLAIPEEKTEVVCSTSESFIEKSASSWDVVFFDPPYEHDYRHLIHLLGNDSSERLAPDGTLIVEHHLKSNVPDATGEIRRWRIVRQGESCLSFYSKN